MKLFKVTFRLRFLPWYTITGIEALEAKEALFIATEQMHIEIGEGHPMKKPVVEMTLNIDAEASFGAEG